MLTITVPRIEGFNNDTQEFITYEPRTITMEHSLLSLSKWESKWKIPYMGEQRTPEQFLDYIHCMIITPKDINLDYIVTWPAAIIDQIAKYIQEPQTATTIHSRRKGGGGQVITSELIYFWMSSYRIPFEVEKWHLSRLMTLLQVASEENDPNSRKMNKRDIMKNNAALNAARRLKNNTKG